MRKELKRSSARRREKEVSMFTADIMKQAEQDVKIRRSDSRFVCCRICARGFEYPLLFLLDQEK